MHYPVAGLRVFETPEIATTLDESVTQFPSERQESERAYYRYVHAEYRTIKALWELYSTVQRRAWYWDGSAWIHDPDRGEAILDELGIELRWRLHDEQGNPLHDEVVGYVEEIRP